MSEDIKIYVATMLEYGNVETYWATIARGDRSKVLAKHSIRARIELIVDSWKYLLLDAPKPDPREYDTDPSRHNCVACGKPDSPRDLGSCGPYRCGDCIVL